MFKAIVAICIGASLGALLRWGFSLALNNWFPAIPPGTLLANLVGGYIIGLAVGYFSTSPDVSLLWRLFIITGFCGGLTTFSTFSAEVVGLLREGRVLMALAATGVHLTGSVLMTFAGIGTYVWLSNASHS